MTAIKFHYEGNTPSKKNQKRIVRRKDGAPFIMASTDYARWHKGAHLEMKLQMSRITGVTWPLSRTSQVIIRLFYEDRRRRDSTNTVESIMDLLVDAGILADDCWVMVGPMGIFPSLRPDAPGWDIQLHLADFAPGLAEVHTHFQKGNPK